MRRSRPRLGLALGLLAVVGLTVSYAVPWLEWSGESSNEHVRLEAGPSGLVASAVRAGQEPFVIEQGWATLDAWPLEFARVALLFAVATTLAYLLSQLLAQEVNPSLNVLSRFLGVVALLSAVVAVLWFALDAPTTIAGLDVLGGAGVTAAAMQATAWSMVPWGSLLALLGALVAGWPARPPASSSDD